MGNVLHQIERPLSVLWVSFNYKMAPSFLLAAKEIMFKSLNRRSQRKSFTWEKFEKFLAKHPLSEANCTPIVLTK